MTLDDDSIEWAIESIAQQSDGDLFPPIPEIKSIQDTSAFLAPELTRRFPNIPILPSRRFIVPKSSLSYRQITQLHPQDTILLTAALYQFGRGIEVRRLPKHIVYSHRFSPGPRHELYGSKSYWTAFWNTAKHMSSSYACVLTCDIADFYNQVYHHTIENQLHESGFPNAITKWINKLLGSTTAGVSRGIPIGPHATHLLAECSLIPIDESLRTHGIVFIRYVDDFVVFSDSWDGAREALFVIAKALDKQQRLILQHSKTRIMPPQRFADYCNRRLDDRPISDEEDTLLEVVRRHSDGDPYGTVTYDELSEDDWNLFASEVVDRIITAYLQQDEIHYFRLRWLFRRLAQVGHPGALRTIIDNFEFLEPCVAEVCAYISSIRTLDTASWPDIGAGLLEMLDEAALGSNEFFRLSILSLFSKNRHVNHFSKLASSFGNRDQHARREILLAAKEHRTIDWLREHKEDFGAMDPWQKMAFVYSSSMLPRDERKFFLRHVDAGSPFDQCLVRWARQAGASGQP